MDDLDNPGRRSAARPSDNTSANSYGFAVASTTMIHIFDGIGVQSRDHQPAWSLKPRGTLEERCAYEKHPGLDLTE
jgi:hypothetical protein